MAACPNCTTDNPPGAEFCAHCGARLDGSALAPQPPASSPANVGGAIAAGCLGVFAGLALCYGLLIAILWFFSLHVNSPLGARISQLGAIALGVLGFIWLLRSGASRPAPLQAFLVVTLVTALGSFALCSTIFLASFGGHLTETTPNGVSRPVPRITH